jgi:polyhydroxyalkanoate synthesis regulator phasin
MMDDPKKAQEFLDQIAGKAVETMTEWADANQRVLHEMVKFGAASAKEGVRLYAELQQSAIEALRDSQATALRWQTAWQDSAKDPAQLYQKALAEGVENAQKAFKVLETQAQAVARSAERLQTSAEQAGKGIQETYTAVVSKMRDVFAHS